MGKTDKNMPRQGEDRRKFVACSALLLLSSCRTQPTLVSEARSAPTVSVKTYGARGDGVIDDTAAISRAVTDGRRPGDFRVVFFPEAAEYYRVTRPIIIPSNTRIVGTGMRSAVVNDNRDNSVFGSQMVFLPGAYANDRINNLTYDRAYASDVRNAIHLKRGAAGRYIVGQSVIVRDSASVEPDSLGASRFLRFAVVESIHEDVLYLSSDIANSIDDLSISPSDDEIDFFDIPGLPKNKCFVGRNIHIDQLKIGSLGHWTGYTACDSCSFTNLTIDSSVGVYGNSYQNCLWQDIEATFSRQLIELASNSYNTVVRRIGGERVRAGRSAEIVRINEGADHVQVEDLKIRDVVSRDFAELVSVGPSSNVIIKRVIVETSAWRGSLIGVDPRAGTVHELLIEDCVFTARSAPAHALRLVGDTRVSNTVIQNNRFISSGFSGPPIIMASRGCKLINNKFEGLPSNTN